MNAQQGLLQQAVPQTADQAPEASNSAIDAAMTFVMQALYEKNLGAQLVQALNQAEDKVEVIANAAYDLADTAGEKTEGFDPEDAIVLVQAILSELGDIAETQGIQLDMVTIGQAMKLIILRFLGELGVDASELEQAMGAYTPEMMAAVGDYVQGGEA